MLLITGATGQVGGETARELLRQGQAVRVLVRDPQSPAAQALAAAGAELAPGDQARPDTLAAAFAGISAVLLGSANDEGQVERESNVIAAAEAAGVERIVKLAALGTAPGSPISILATHAAVEARLAASSVAWTSLRPGSFMQNFLRYTDTITGHGAFYGCQGEAPIAMVDVRDLAAVAAGCLTQDGHAGQVYEVTGPEALSHAQAAGAIAEATGQPCTYVDVPGAAAREAMVGMGLPGWLADDLVALAAHFDSPLGRNVTTVVPDITGRPARSFATFARDHVSQFTA